MKLIIDIPEEAYELLNNEGVDWLGAEHILNAVANGTPLPKGHGDLIDRDEVIMDMKLESSSGYCDYDPFEPIVSAKTIVEAEEK